MKRRKISPRRLAKMIKKAPHSIGFEVSPDGKKVSAFATNGSFRTNFDYDAFTINAVLNHGGDLLAAQESYVDELFSQKSIAA